MEHGASPDAAPVFEVGPSRRSVLVTGATVAGVALVGGSVVTACGAPPPPPAPPSSGVRLAALDAVAVGGSVVVMNPPNSEPVVVARPSAGMVVAYSGVCTHQGCSVEADGATVSCPCHGSVFDAATGVVRQGPAQDPLPAVAVRVANGQVVAT